MFVKVCFNGDCYVVAAVQDPVDADRFDESATIRRAEKHRTLRHPLADPLDQETVKVTLQRHIAEPEQDKD